MRAAVRKGLCVLLCLLMLCPVPARAAGTEQTQAIIRDLIGCYFHYRDAAAAEIDNQLETLSSIDPQQGAVWREIMDTWAWINAEMPVCTGVLPDGLPADDSLCIVVLGYGLNRDGSMKQELLDRLAVAKASAEKYPEACILCTGGETSDVRGVSEAGEMAAWLKANGIRESRLIVEAASLSTTANAQNSCRILWRDYPQVSSIAIVSSDYHIPWGAACFAAMCIKGAGEGERRLELAGNASCTTSTPNTDTMYSQAWGISIIAGVSFDSTQVPVLYMSENPAVPETESPVMTVSEPVAEQPRKTEPVVPVLLTLAAVLVLLFIPKKRKKSGSN